MKPNQFYNLFNDLLSQNTILYARACEQLTKDKRCLVFSGLRSHWAEH